MRRARGACANPRSARGGAAAPAHGRAGQVHARVAAAGRGDERAAGPDAVPGGQPPEQRPRRLRQDAPLVQGERPPPPSFYPSYAHPPAPYPFPVSRRGSSQPPLLSNPPPSPPHPNPTAWSLSLPLRSFSRHFAQSLSQLFRLELFTLPPTPTTSIAPRSTAAASAGGGGAGR